MGESSKRVIHFQNKTIYILYFKKIINCFKRVLVLFKYKILYADI